MRANLKQLMIWLDPGAIYTKIRDNRLDKFDTNELINLSTWEKRSYSKETIEFLKQGFFTEEGKIIDKCYFSTSKKMHTKRWNEQDAIQYIRSTIID